MMMMMIMYLVHGETTPPGFMLDVSEGVVIETTARNVEDSCKSKLIARVH